MNGAQALIRTLVASGVDTCFMNPGTSEMHFVAALDSVPEMRAVLALFEGVDKRRGDVTVELRCGDDPMTLVSSGGRVQLAAGRLDAPDVVLTGRPDAVVGLIAGALRPAEASAHGVSVTGDARRLSRLRPRHRRS